MPVHQNDLAQPGPSEKRPLVERLRASTEWLRRDGFLTSAELAAEAAAEIDRLHALLRDMRMQCAEIADDQWVRDPRISGGNAIRNR